MLGIFGKPATQKESQNPPKKNKILVRIHDDILHEFSKTHESSTHTKLSRRKLTFLRLGGFSV